MNKNTILINGRAYDWASIKIEALGGIFSGVTAISYGSNQEKVNNYGAGSEPVSRGRGNKEYNFSITLDMGEFRRILAALPNGSGLEDIPPFTITVAYLLGSKTIVDKVFNCEFPGQKMNGKQGDKNLEMELEGICAGIQWGK